MDDSKVTIPTGDYYIGKSPQVLYSFGIGSCIVICLYHKESSAGGLIHAMLPKRGKSSQNTSRFIDSGLLEMVSKLNKLGMPSEEIEAKIVGGSHMFRALSTDGKIDLGEKNLKAAEKVLQMLGIKIESEDVGGSVGRSVEFSLKTGVVKVITKM